MATAENVRVSLLAAFSDCRRGNLLQANGACKQTARRKSVSPVVGSCTAEVAGMEYDRDKVDDMVLALLWLTAFDEDEFGARAWKSHDWDALDRLHEKGYISDPKSKAKSVVLSVEGLQRSRELFERHFGCRQAEI